VWKAQSIVKGLRHLGYVRNSLAVSFIRVSRQNKTQKTNESQTQAEAATACTIHQHRSQFNRFRTLDVGKDHPDTIKVT
jgi:hypothetical protein